MTGSTLDLKEGEGKRTSQGEQFSMCISIQRQAVDEKL